MPSCGYEAAPVCCAHCCSMQCRTDQEFLVVVRLANCAFVPYCNLKCSNAMVCKNMFMVPCLPRVWHGTQPVSLWSPRVQTGHAGTPCCSLHPSCILTAAELSLPMLRQHNLNICCPKLLRYICVGTRCTFAVTQLVVIDHI